MLASGEVWEYIAQAQGGKYAEDYTLKPAGSLLSRLMNWHGQVREHLTEWVERHHPKQGQGGEAPVSRRKKRKS